MDDMNCQYISTMNLGIYSIESRCSELIGKFDFMGVNINVSDNVETNHMSGSVLVGVSRGFDGPAGSEVEVSGAVGVEFDNTGITDYIAKTGISSQVAGVEVIGAEATFTVNTGTSVSGKGILQGINY